MAEQLSLSSTSHNNKKKKSCTRIKTAIPSWVQIPTESPAIPEFPNPYLMHTTQSDAVFPFSVLSRELIHHLNHFLHQSSQNKVNKGVWKEIDQLIASEAWTFHKKWQPEPEDKGQPSKGSAAVCQNTSKLQVMWAGECPSTATESSRQWDSNQNVPSKSCEDTAVKGDRDTQSTAGMRNVLKSLWWHLLHRSSLHPGPIITPSPSEVSPKPLKISVLREGSSNCFIITMAADLIDGRAAATVVSYPKNPLNCKCSDFVYFPDKQWGLFSCQ